tara:strand:- start:246 stop:1598 length:1353 start_codon:yes stop_codon:yes gene_type:complete
MGVFKKLFKGIKKVFKKIARGIKKAFKAFGKFMGKIGFVGQMAMMFLFPGGIGNLLTKGLGKLGAKLAAVGGANPTGLAKAVQGVGNVLTKTQQFVTKARAGFGSITDGIKEFGKTALNKVGFTIDGAAKNFFGTDSAFSRATEGFQESVGGLREAFDKGTMEITEKTSLKDLSNRLGITQNDLKRLNPTLENFLDKDGFLNPREGAYSLNVDLVSGVPTSSAISAAESQRNVQAAITSTDPGKIDPNVTRDFSVDATTGKNFGMTKTKTTTDPFAVEDISIEPDASKAFEKKDFYYPQGPVDLKDAATQERKFYYPQGDQNLANLSQKGIDANADANKNWFLDKKFAGFDFRKAASKTLDPFNPNKQGLIQPLVNAQTLLSNFAEEEIDYGTRGGGLQDYHSGMPPFMPNQYASDTGFDKNTGFFGVPSINEMLKDYGLYVPDMALGNK